MLTNKIFNASALETVFLRFNASYQIYLCFLSKINLISFKSNFAY